MTWSGSGIFNSWQRDAVIPTTSFAGKLGADTFKASLFNNSITPDNTVTSALSGYNATSSQWLTTNEQTDATNWVAGGRALSGTAVSSTGVNYTAFTASNTAGGGNVTLSGVYGDLVYDSSLSTPVANQGLAFHYFGGAQGVTAGTFTIVWNTNGVVRWTHNVA